MKFKRINGNDIQCVITAEEMREYGLEPGDIFSNTAKAQDFLNEILDLVEEQTGCVIGDGAKTVQAVCLPGDAVALTFSDQEPADRDEEMFSSTSRNRFAILAFPTIAAAGMFARTLDATGYEKALFCREKNCFYLIVDLAESSVEKVDHFFAAAFEYAQVVGDDERRAAYLAEHALLLVEKDAMRVLAAL